MNTIKQTTTPELSPYQGDMKHRHLVKGPELPPPLVCKVCGKNNRRYATRDNGSGKRYYNLVCSTCKSSERRRQIRTINDPEKLSAIREQQRKHRLKTKYGITPDEYDVLLQSQDGVCDICKRPNKKEIFMPVDHNHKTGAVRGILCEACNKAIGLFEESEISLHNAVEYIRKHS